MSFGVLVSKIHWMVAPNASAPAWILCTTWTENTNLIRKNIYFHEDDGNPELIHNHFDSLVPKWAKICVFKPIIWCNCQCKWYKLWFYCWMEIWYFKPKLCSEWSRFSTKHSTLTLSERFFLFQQTRCHYGTLNEIV